MNKKIIKVPVGVRYVSDWLSHLPEQPCIVDKKICGCGFTEFAITNSFNVVLLSPRRVLLENKKDQHPEQNVYYFKNDGADNLTYDQDLNGKKLKKNQTDNAERIAALKYDVQTLYVSCKTSGRPCKILTTYDSFRHVRDALGNSIKDFYCVVDEFQSIWIDSRFKSETEMEMLNQLAGLERVCFVSATPMIEKYIEQIDEFKDLPYYEFDWETEEPDRVKKPDIGEPQACKSVFEKACSIISGYLDKKFLFEFGFNSVGIVYSKEAVLYVNSVGMICRIIKKCGLTLENTNVLCARTDDNEKKIRDAFGLHSTESGIGTVPKMGEPHKMFTLCTRTVYLGADFYSNCARSFVFSDANIDSLAVDISMDLPQILGRQRNDMNPWKNRAEFYYTTFKNKSKREALDEFAARMKEKQSATDSLLRTYENALDKDKASLARNYETVAIVDRYKNDYVSVNKHMGATPTPVFNKLVQLGELRAYELQQIEYKDWFSVFAQLNKHAVANTPEMTAALEAFNRCTQFTDKMRVLCQHPSIYDRVPRQYSKYLDCLTPETIKANEYRKGNLDRLVFDLSEMDPLTEDILAVFKVGESYSRINIKRTLQEIFDRHGISRTATATTLREWFLAIDCTMTIDGERVNGLKLVAYNFQ